MNRVAVDIGVHVLVRGNDSISPASTLEWHNTGCVFHSCIEWSIPPQVFESSVFSTSGMVNLF